MKKNSDNFSLSYWQIFDITLFGSNMNGVLMTIDSWIQSEAKKKWIATVNPEFVVKATKDENFKDILKQTDLNVVDGIGLIWAREVRGRNFITRLGSAWVIGIKVLKGEYRDKLVAGSDLMPALCKLAARKGYKVFFLGGFDNRAERTAGYFESNFKMTKGQIEWSSGEPKVKNEEVVRQINKFKPDILFVAYGMKKQEEWIMNNKSKLNFGVAVGVGRSFDYYSGDLKRAPMVWRKIGMEWFYSLIKEPKRIRRQLELPKFVWKVLKDKE